MTDYKKPSEAVLKERLTKLQYRVTQENATESPFSSSYWNAFDDGLYVDITTGEPLFSSRDKFESSCGWPSFSKPIEKDAVQYLEDISHFMKRTEVRSHAGDAHLGHVFDDGPEELGGQRYCINGAALRFIPKEKLEDEGYGDFLVLFK